jgi:hypothetical protein
MAFALDDIDEQAQDNLDEKDWQVLKDTETILALIFSLTKRLEGHAVGGDYGLVWEALPGVEALIQYLDKIKKIYTQDTHPQLATSINLAWSKLDEYYKKLDDSPAYAAVLLCHPSFRWHCLSNKWIGQLRKYQAPMKKALQKLYDDKYKPQPKEEKEQTEQQEGPDFLDSYLEDILPGAILEDQYTGCAFGLQTPILPGTLYEHWSKESAIPAMRQMVYDYLSIPAMSSESERAFSGAN